MKPLTPVLILTHEGDKQRGKRRWRPGESTGVVIDKHRPHLFDRAWTVQVNGHTVVLFEDEIQEITS